MRKTTKIILAISAALTCVCAALIYFLFHGYFDVGLFQVKQAVWFSPNQIAVVAERSDKEALGGLEYFVLIGDHVPSPAELKHALYSDAPVFSAGDECLSLRWASQNNLVIECKGGVLAADHINRQKSQSGKILVSYKNIGRFDGF